MLCPKCRGEAFIRIEKHGYIGRYFRREPCDFPGCHNGHVSCCTPENDGLPKGEDDGAD